jgi:anti-sigma28 factor (negative regulator of flagellin synthesis)
MRIGSIHVPQTGAAEPVGRSNRGDRSAQSSVRQPADDTADLLALSAGVSLRAVLDTHAIQRQSLVDQLARTWKSGAYCPDAERIAEKLLDLGFDGSSPAL